MLRKSQPFPIIILKEFFNIHPVLKNNKIELRIDEKNAKQIILFLAAKDRKGKFKHRKKFNRILYTVFSGRYAYELYDKEEVSSKAKNVTAMKFKGNENYRIGCKEISCNNKIVIMVTCFHKKSQKNSKKELAIYEAIGGYDYEC